MTDNERDKAESKTLANLIIANTRKQASAELDENYEKCQVILEERDLFLPVFARRSADRDNINYEDELKSLYDVYDELYKLALKTERLNRKY